MAFERLTMATSKAICIRINSGDKKFLAKIAAGKGVSLSAFLRSAATVEAQRIIDATLHVKP